MNSQKPIKTKAGAYRSPLWNHLDGIRKKRIARATWNEIVDWLNAQHNISIARPTLVLFFKRATSPNRRRPLGFEAAPALNTEPQPTLFKPLVISTKTHSQVETPSQHALPPLHNGDEEFGYFSEADHLKKSAQQEIENARKRGEEHEAWIKQLSEQHNRNQAQKESK
jgi:hypothetical protein